MNSIAFDTIDDDTCIDILSFLEVPQLLIIRQTCKRFYYISKQYIVWHNACTTHVLHRGFPFTRFPLSSFDSAELERRTLRAYRLGNIWRSPRTNPHRAVTFDANPSSPIEYIHFLPGNDGKRFITASKGIWSVVTVWDTRGDGNLNNGMKFRKLAEWAPKGAIFGGLVVNTELYSEAAVAVSVQQSGSSRVEILSLGSEEDISFRTLNSVDTYHRPSALCGDLVALTDTLAETVIWNWKENTYAILRNGTESDVWQDHSFQVIFAHKSIVVVRAHTIHIFAEPILEPYPAKTIHLSCASHNFGWVDGVSISVRNSRVSRQTPDRPQSLSVLTRTRSDDPWSVYQTRHRLYALEPVTDNPALTSSQEGSTNISPYTFPSQPLAEVVSAHHGPLRCTDIGLGPFGTAVWVQPRDRTAVGLISSDVHLQQIPIPHSSAQDEALIAGIFPGAFHDDDAVVEIKLLWNNPSNNWTCLDYDEENGLIAIGSNSGAVTLLEI